MQSLIRVNILSCTLAVTAHAHHASCLLGAHARHGNGTTLLSCPTCGLQVGSHQPHKHRLPLDVPVVNGMEQDPFDKQVTERYQVNIQAGGSLELSVLYLVAILTDSDGKVRCCDTIAKVVSR